MINFILFATNPKLFADEITHIKSLLQRNGTESVIINDRTELICLIPKLCKEKSVVLLFASSGEELDDYVNIRECFGAISVVLILPDDDTARLQRAMLLHPLYFIAKHAVLNHFSLAVNDLCDIYANHFTEQTTRNNSYNSLGGIES